MLVKIIRKLFIAQLLLLVFGKALLRNKRSVSTSFLKIKSDGPGNCTVHSPFYCADGNGCVDRAKEFCDEEPQCSDGSDETEYIPHIHDELGGIDCYILRLNVSKINRCYLPKEYICDHERDCTLGTDECGCSHTFECDASPYFEVDKQCVSRVDFCDNVQDCFDKTDERKYRPGVQGFQCAVSKTRVTSFCMLPDKHTCDGIQDCDDGTDECFCNETGLIPPTESYSNGRCFRCLDGSLVIPHRQLCDGEFHCKDLSDECMCPIKPEICEQVCQIDDSCEKCEVGQVLCKKENVTSPVKCIDRSYICDGSYDCPLEDDEESCNRDFSELFNCSDGTMYILKYQQCDKLPDCPDQSDEKDCPELFFECYPESVYNSTVRTGAFEQARPRYTKKCDLIPTCEDFEDECNETLCGSPLPEYCKFVEGRTGFVCPNTLSALIGTQICDGFPSCSEKAPEASADELYCPYRFYCQDKGAKSLPIHVANSSRCDSISDCFDESDELNCSLATHFYCNSGLPRYVPRSKVCNGIQDCTDGEDECQDCSNSPFSSDTHLINSYVLQIFIWIIGLFAVIGNIGVLLHNSWQLWRSRDTMTKMAYNHRILVTSLGLADLLLGVYLLSLGIVNTTYKDIYCRRDIQWRSSQACVAIGSMAVISTECSIFLLVTMATMRLCLVTRPFSGALKRRYIVTAVIVCWILAITLAAIPLTERYTDYFLSEVWYQNNPFLTLSKRKKVEELVSWLGSLEKKGFSEFSTTTVRSLSWTSMIETISQLNSSYVPNLYFGYYSAHGVCLPRIFPDPSADRSWGFSFFVVTLNFLGFIYMFIAYVAIYRITTSRSRDAGRTDNDVASALLQHKISRIIFTNFCCWIPICVMAFISTAGGYVSQEAYAVSAIVLLPINSAFNPLLYSDLPELIWENVIVKTKCGKWVEMRRLLSAESSRRRNKFSSAYSSKQTRSTRVSTNMNLTPTQSLALQLEVRS